MYLRSVFNMWLSIPQISSAASEYIVQHFLVFFFFVFLSPNRILKFLARTVGKHSFFLSLLMPRLLWAVSGKQYTLLLLRKLGQIGIS